MKKQIIFLSFFVIMFQVTITAQSYFKKLSHSTDFFNQKITRFSNGDLLIGDSASASASNNASDGTIYLSRIDPCGNTVWSYEYYLPTGFIEFKDFKINGVEEIFVYGSYYGSTTLQEFIFLLKVDGETGISSDYHLFRTGAVDRFAYSLDLKGNNLMIYGLLLGEDFERQGFIGVFNKNLQFQWAKKFRPFDTTGHAIVNKENGIVSWSSKYIMKFDGTGNSDWAVTLQSDPNFIIVSGPLEVSDGYIFEGHRQGKSFFYKIGENGEWFWQTELFPALKFGAALTALSNEKILCTYGCLDNDATTLCQLTLTIDGKLENQKQLVTENSLNIGKIYQSRHSDGTLNMVGNADPFMTQATDVKDFVAQFAADSLAGDCMFWKDIENFSANNLTPSLEFYEPNPITFDMEREEIVETDTMTFSMPLENICIETFDTDLLRQDTLLPCGEDWTVALPDADFEWVDGRNDNPRTLSIPGVYKAKNRDCINPITVQYVLEKENCECQVYLPNAFSPNRDGINDELAYFSDCELDEVEFSVYSRWGDLLFFTNELAHFWDGKSNGKTVTTGVYMALLKYQWTDFDGNEHENVVVQEVVVLH